jgi:hypothetical protein
MGNFSLPVMYINVQNDKYYKSIIVKVPARLSKTNISRETLLCVKHANIGGL